MGDSMKHTAVPASALTEFGRMDADFHILAAEHKELYLELIAKFDRAGLVHLAKTLPRDARAYAAIVPTRYVAAPTMRFDAWLAAERTRLTDLAVYAAAAAQHATSKVLEQMLELGKQRKAMLDELLGLFRIAKEKDAKALLTAMVFSTPP